MLNQEINKVLQGDAPKLVSYSYYDVVNGRGYQIFYGAMTNSNGKKIAQSTSGAFLLTTTPIYSDIVDPRCAAADLGTTYVKVQDLDFDGLFNLPTKIEGKSFVMLSHGINNVTVGQTTYSYIQVRARKWNGTTETELAVASGANFFKTGVTNGSQTICLAMELPLTTFKVGDSLRLTVENWALNGAAADADLGFGADPQDRNVQTTTRPISYIADTDTTKLEFHVPFVIDV